MKQNSNTALPKILLSIPNTGFSGAEKQIVYLADGLRSRGYDIHICNLEGHGPQTDVFEKMGLEYTVIERERKFDLMRLWKYVKLIREGKYDIVISFLYLANNFTRLVKIFVPKSNFFHIAGERGRDFKSRNLTIIFDSLISNKSDVIITNATSIKKQLMELEKIKADKIHIIPNGVDFQRYQAKQDYEIRECVKFITIGGLYPVKNHMMLLDVLSRLKHDMNLKFKMNIVGEGQLRSRIEEEIKSRSLVDSVFLLGWRDDIPHLLEASDIFLFTSHSEGLPNAVLEAMTVGLPIISTAVDGILNVIENGKNGILVDAEDSTAMTAKIIELINDEKLRQNLGENARKTILQGFSIDKMVESYIELFPNSHT